MLKRLIAIVGGILLGATVIGLVEMLVHQAYPVPAGLDPQDREAMGRFLASLPRGAYIGVLLAWAAGAFTAGWFASLVSPVDPQQHSLIAGMGLTLLALMNLIQVPHPAWFWVPGLLLHLPMARIGGWLITGKEDKGK